MAQLATYRTVFCNTIEQMLTYLDGIFPGDAELRVFRFGYTALQQHNPELVLENYLNHAYRYKDQIMAHDLHFFYHNADNIAQQSRPRAAAGDDDDTMSFTAALRNKVDRMSVEQQTQLWKYMEAMTLICERYYALKLNVS